MADLDPAKFGASVVQAVEPTVEPTMSPEQFGVEQIAEVQRPQFRPPTTLEEIGRGAADITQGLEQLYYMATDPQAAEKFTAEKTAEMQMYERGRGEDAGFDWWRMAGTAAMAAPTALYSAPASLAGRMVLGATEGAAIAGSIFTPEGESKVAQTAVGAVAGGIAPVAMQSLGRLGASSYRGLSDFYRSTGRKVGDFFSPKQITVKIDNELAKKGVDLADLSETAQENLSKHISESLKATGKIDIDAALRKTEIEEMGLTGATAPTAAQISRDPIKWRTETSLSQIPEMGDELIYRGAAQKQQLGKKGEEIAEELGGRAKTMPEAEEVTFGALESRWIKSQDDVGKLYDKAAKAKGSDELFPVDEFIENVKPVLDESQDFIPPSLVGDIKKVISGESTPTIKEMTALRKRIGSMAKSSDGSIRYAGGQLSRAIDDAGDMAVGVESEALKAYSAARQAARKRFQEFDVGAARSTPLSRIAAGKGVPDGWIRQNIMRGKAQDVQKTLKILEKEDPLIRGDIKTEVMRDIVERATKQGEGKFSHSQLRSAWDAIPAKNKGLIFSPKEIKLIDKYKRVSEWVTTAPEGAVKGSQTMPMLLDLLNSVDAFPYLGAALSPLVRPMRNSMKEAFQKKQITNAMAGKIDDGLDKIQAIRDAGDMWATKLTPAAPTTAAAISERALSE